MLTVGPLKRHSLGLGGCAVEGISAKRVGKEPNLALLLRTVAVATAGKTGAKWDFSPRVAAYALLPRSLLGHTLGAGLERWGAKREGGL